MDDVVESVEEYREESKVNVTDDPAVIVVADENEKLYVDRTPSF